MRGPSHLPDSEADPGRPSDMPSMNPPSTLYATDEGAVYTAGWVAERLGVTSATLRSWHHRYGLDPIRRTRGGHRRYSARDVRRLEAMCRLIASGVPVGESARLSHVVVPNPLRTAVRRFDRQPDAAEHPPVMPRHSAPGGSVDRRAPTGQSVVAARHVELLTQAATGLEQVATSRIVVEVLHTYGVVRAWTDVLAPALRLRGEQFARTGNAINVEHLLSECIRAALSTFAWRQRRWRRMPVVLLAAPDGEHHVLALHALAAALAEVRRHSVMLGSSVPPRALVDSVARLDPSATFLWSHSVETAHRPDFTSIRRRTGQAAPAVVLGGPGWPHESAERVDDLTQALQACVLPTLPSLDRPPTSGAGLIAS